MRNSPEEANEFALASEDALSSSAVATLNSTQIWKDLQRDQVRVNGELVVGRTRGAEGIVAAVARHIMATAQTTSKLSATAPGSSIASFTSPTNLLSPRSVAEGARKKSPGKDVSSTSTLPSLNSSLSYISRIAKRLGASTNETESSNSDGAFHLSEAHALACAKEVLTMCNRTQSGGDTYFCVESLLAKCGLDSVAADRLCVLTPFDTESEPLEISLSVGMTATGTDVRELDGSSNNSDPLSLSPRNAPAKSSQLRHPSPDLASFPNAQAILDSEQDDRLGKRDSATTATTTTTDSLSTKYSLSASSSSSLSWLKKTLNPSQQALHMPAAGEDTSALASIRRKSNNSMISGIAGQLRRSSGVTESSSDGSPRKLKSDGINPALPSSSAIRISSSSSKMGSSIPVTIRQLSSDNLDIFNQEQASSVSPSAPSGLTQNLNRLSQRKALSTDSGDGDIDADEEADLFDRVDVSSVPDSDGGSGAGSLFELEDDDISVVSELVEELVDADGDLDSSTFISSEDHDTPSQRSTASLTKTASGGIVESHMVTGPGSPIDTRDDLLRRRLIAKSASAAVHPTTPSLASAMLGLPRSGEGRPKARFESESSLGPDAGDSVMEYEVKPRSALSLFKGKSFKIFEPLGGNHRSNSALGASAALEKSMSQLGASFRVQFPSDTPGDMVQRRKASLSGIYESQLSSLGQSRPPEVVIRILVKAESRYRLCCTDPQGDDSDHWASVTAVFQQVFVVYSDSNGAPTPMDRFVTLNFDKDIKKASKV